LGPESRPKQTNNLKVDKLNLEIINLSYWKILDDIMIKLYLVSTIYGRPDHFLFRLWKFGNDKSYEIWNNSGHKYLGHFREITGK
jgi:hypothetical protein